MLLSKPSCLRDASQVQDRYPFSQLIRRPALLRVRLPLPTDKRSQHSAAPNTYTSFFVMQKRSAGLFISGSHHESVHPINFGIHHRNVIRLVFQDCDQRFHKPFLQTPRVPEYAQHVRSRFQLVADVLLLTMCSPVRVMKPKLTQPSNQFTARFCNGPAALFTRSLPT